MQNSPISLAYYNNVLSTIALVPMVIFTGEAPGAMRLLSGTDAPTFYWGAAITVRLPDVPAAVRLKTSDRVSLGS